MAADRRDAAAGTQRRREPTRRLVSLNAEIVGCRHCPRLVAWRESCAEHPRAVRGGPPYWARPLPGFGDPDPRLLIVGLAPAANGANRTGRMFTGDRSGDFLFAALHRAGYADRPASTGLEDGLTLRGAFITAAVRCAPPENRPTPDERNACAPYLVRELELFTNVRVVLALGAFAFDALWRLEQFAGHREDRPRRPRFGHGLEVRLPRQMPDDPERTLLGSYHPSQRNVFTGRLDAAGFDRILSRARALGA